MEPGNPLDATWHHMDTRIWFVDCCIAVFVLLRELGLSGLGSPRVSPPWPGLRPSAKTLVETREMGSCAGPAQTRMVRPKVKAQKLLAERVVSHKPMRGHAFGCPMGHQLTACQ